MAKSTQVITDLKTAVATAPSATAQIAAQNASNMMQDPVAMFNLALIKAEELKKILNELVLDSSGVNTTNAIIQTATDSAIFTALDSVRQVLV